MELVKIQVTHPDLLRIQQQLPHGFVVFRDRRNLYGKRFEIIRQASSTGPKS